MISRSLLLLKTLALIAVQAVLVITVCRHVFASASAGTYVSALATPDSSAKWGIALYDLGLMLLMGWLLNCLADSVRRVYDFATAQASSHS